MLAERARRRDFFVLGALFIGVSLLLTFSGSLSVGEAITSLIIFCFAALAYYLSTVSTSADNAIYTEFAAQRREQYKLDAASSALSAAGLRDDIRALIEAFPQPALLTDADGRVFISNEEAQSVFKLPKVGGFGPSIIRRPDVLRQLERIEAGKTPEPLGIEITGTPDRYFNVLLEPMTILGEKRILLILMELTELRRAQKARADFLANASHELRTPLTSLAGFIETMRGPAKDDPEAWDRFLEIMHGQTDRMRRLIHDLLSLSRIELNEHRRPDQKINLSGVVAENVEALVPIATDKGIELELISSADSAPVHGVRDELVQVIQNLIDNALKYTSSGSKVRVEVSAGLDLEQARTFAGRRWVSASRVSIVQSTPEQGARFAVLRVSDEGAGIPRQHLPRLGERFYRVDEGRDRSVGGTGLGLAIVKHIVARHRGGLMVESEEGYGSAFGIWLPMIAEAAEPQNTAPSGAPPSGPPETN